MVVYLLLRRGVADQNEFTLVVAASVMTPFFVVDMIILRLFQQKQKFAAIAANLYKFYPAV